MFACFPKGYDETASKLTPHMVPAKEKTLFLGGFVGAEEGGRTPTPLRATDFKSVLSASSNTPASKIVTACRGDCVTGSRLPPVPPIHSVTQAPRHCFLEARVGIEPTHKGFADPRLTIWLPRHIQIIGAGWPRPLHRPAHVVTNRLRLIVQEATCGRVAVIAERARTGRRDRLLPAPGPVADGARHRTRAARLRQESRGPSAVSKPPPVA